MKIRYDYILICISLFACRPTKNQLQPKEKSKMTSVPPLDTAVMVPPHERGSIVDLIAAINEVQYEHVGFAGSPSANYRNFLRLKQTATLDELINLTNHSNPVVACYAGWALADQSYSNFIDIFVQFQSKDQTITTFAGCTKMVDNISTELYHRYWNQVDDSLKAADRILSQLDSVVLYNDSSHWLLTTRAFNNRIYSESYKTRIENLAFKQSNQDALFYLCNWHRAEYSDNLKQSFITYLNKTDFSTTGTTDYYRTLEELLKFRDRAIQPLLIQKLRKDPHWKSEKNKFKSLLDDYNIYENFD